MTTTLAAPTTPLQLIEPGLVDYREAWELQRRLHAERRAGERDDTVVLLQHPSVYTAGKRTADKDRPQDGTPVVEVDRGGLITWHGPGQLVGYPIIELPKPLDVVAYIRRMEGMLIGVCADLGLATTRIEGRTGVWIPGDGGPDRKVAAIGVRVSFRVTLHGFALNCNPDLTAFDKIVACGLDDAVSTSISTELGRTVTVDEVLPLVRRRLEQLRTIPTAAA